MKIVSILVFIGACVLLYFGSGMLMVVQGYPGEGYFAPRRILYGVLPTILSAALLVSVGWLWTRSDSAVSLRKAIANSFAWALGAIGLFWIGLLIVASFRQD